MTTTDEALFADPCETAGVAEKSRKPRHYATWNTDSTRWNPYEPRSDDIIIATYPKSGTTWTQRIVDLLVHRTPEPRAIDVHSPWVDMRFGGPVDEMMARLEAQPHRRYLKSHLPMDGLPYHEEVRYVHVARDGRDVAMSYFNHCSAYTPKMYELQDSAADVMDGPAPRCPADAATFFRNWLSKGVGDGARDGFPTFSYFDFENGYWRGRAHSNLLLVHYNDLKADLPGEMERIADFLSIEIPKGDWPRLVAAAGFATMKRQGRELLPKMDLVFQGGSQRFLYKGTNRRWQGVIPDELLERYEAMVTERFSPALKSWIEGGRLGAGDPRTVAD